VSVSEVLAEYAGHHAERGSPLTLALLQGAARDWDAGGVTREVLSPYENDPPGSALPLRFTAALHRLVLDRQAPELALHYPTAGGQAPPEAAWPAARRLLAAGCWPSTPGWHAGWSGWRARPTRSGAASRCWSGCCTSRAALAGRCGYWSRRFGRAEPAGRPLPLRPELRAAGLAVPAARPGAGDRGRSAHRGAGRLRPASAGPDQRRGPAAAVGQCVGRPGRPLRPAAGRTRRRRLRACARRGGRSRQLAGPPAARGGPARCSGDCGVAQRRTPVRGPRRVGAGRAAVRPAGVWRLSYEPDLSSQPVRFPLRVHGPGTRPGGDTLAYGGGHGPPLSLT